ncbi:MAG: ornithine cyclodeaminase family protein [Betaproteobacteria bacterium]|nr:ornithine cyclodeaminase family protein [Betaproteobacteria bacterium]
MIRYLNEKDVESLLTMPLALQAVEQALHDLASARAVDVPRVRAHIPAGTLHVLEAAAPELGVIGYKAYYALHGKGTRYYINLFNSNSGVLEAIIEASYVGMVRTGAASGVATRYMAREDSRVVGMIGAGKQAVGQLEAVCQVRDIREVRVYSRTHERARRFCESMSSRLGLEVQAVPDVAEAIRGADIINVITKAADPVLPGALLTEGQHINAAGSNALSRRELDEAAVRRANRVVVDARGTASKECGDLLPVVEKGFFHWESLPELGEVVAGRVPGRTTKEEITLFESQGMGIQDIYVGARLLAIARERGVGVDLPIGS